MIRPRQKSRPHGDVAEQGTPDTTSRPHHALSLTAWNVASAQGLDGLFLHMRLRSGSIQENHDDFLPDGRYLNALASGSRSEADDGPATLRESV